MPPRQARAHRHDHLHGMPVRMHRVSKRHPQPTPSGSIQAPQSSQDFATRRPQFQNRQQPCVPVRMWPCTSSCNSVIAFERWPCQPKANCPASAAPPPLHQVAQHLGHDLSNSRQQPSASASIQHPASLILLCDDPPVPSYCPPASLHQITRLLVSLVLLDGG